MSKYMVLGACGQLGQAVMASFPDVQGFGKKAADITNVESLRKVIEIFTPEWIINCAAYTDVDGAQRHWRAATQVNTVGPANLAALSFEYGFKVCHISTDHVFPGTKGANAAPYHPPRICGPVNRYGETKWYGERFISAMPKMQHLIVRTSWVFGGENDFLRKMLWLADKHGKILVTEGQTACPTYAYDLARALRKLLDSEDPEIRGTVHWTNGGQAARERWVQQALKAADMESVEIEKVPFGYFGEEAARPKDSRLQNSRKEVYEIAPNRHWTKAVDEYVKELRADGAL